MELVPVERCGWCGDNELYVKYHDEEWGVPVHEDGKHFEFMVLEAAQAGLSWLTVLRKREHYRLAYDGFDPEVVARFDDGKVEQLLADAGIVRNVRKIRASINNAGRFVEVQRDFGSFDRYLWQFVDHKPVVNGWETLSDVPPRTALSNEISVDLVRRGFTFVGSTIVYAHLQATGIVNDHIKGCFRYADLADFANSRGSQPSTTAAE